MHHNDFKTTENDAKLIRLPRLVSERVPEVRFSGMFDPESAEKWVEGKFNKAFLHFLPNFCHIC